MPTVERLVSTHTVRVRRRHVLASSVSSKASSVSSSASRAARKTAHKLDSAGDRFVHAVRSARVDLADGALARIIAVALLYPLDAAKARLQVSSVTSRRAVRAVMSQGVRGGNGTMLVNTPGHSPTRAAIKTTEGGIAGWLALGLRRESYAGLPAAILGQLPYGALTYGAFEVFRSEFDRKQPSWSPGKRVIVSACLADLVGALWIAPLEHMKLKIQAGVYPSLPAAIAETARAAGFKGLFHGFVAQALRDMPFRALQIAAYARAKKFYVRKFKNKAPTPGEAILSPSVDMTAVDTILLGSAVGAVIGALTTPLDVIRTRIMSQRFAPGNVYGNWWSCLSRSVKVEGPAVLFRGVIPRTIYVAGSVALFSLGYEASRKYIGKNKALWHADVAVIKHSSRRRLTH